MVMPASTGHGLDIILKFSMDAAANDRVQRGVSTLEDELKRLAGAFPGDKLAKETDKFNTKLKETEKTVKQTSATLKAEARVLSAMASEMVNGLEKAQTGVIRSLAGQLESVSKLSLATGTALIGGILGFANKYVNNAEEATAVTVAWKAAQDDLNKSGERIGAVLAQEALPLLREGAKLARDVASFVETHPEAVSAALNTGKILIGLGAIGLLASKGIKLVADAKYLLTIPTQLTAAKLQDQAATKQLEAALLRAKDFGINIPGKGAGGGAAAGLAGALAGLMPILLAIAAGGAAFKFIGGKAANTGAKAFGFESPEAFWDEMKASLGLVRTASDAASSSLEQTASDLGSAKFSPQFDQVLKAYEQYRKDDLAATQQYIADKKSIEQDSLEASRRANQNYANDVRRINTQLSSAISSATKSYNQELARAEADNAKQRAQIIRDAGEEIAQIEQELQETLRKNALEHEQRTSDLTAARDALGLAKEAQRFNQEQNEARREANQEVAQRRRDVAQRLADLQQGYEEERAERLADYQSRLAEIRSNANQQLAELRQKHQEELRQIQLDRNNKLRELNNTLNEERKQRHAALIAQIRDLDAGLLGEKNLRQQYQTSMLKDLDSFLGQYRSKLGTLTGLSGATGSSGGFAAGGYTPNNPSNIRAGEAGYEYVMSNRTTRAAEAMIGGRLTQQGLLSALSGMGGSRSNVTWNDQRRFSGEYTNAIRNANRQDTIELLGGLFS